MLLSTPLRRAAGPLAVALALGGSPALADHDGTGSFVADPLLVINDASGDVRTDTGGSPTGGAAARAPMYDIRQVEAGFDGTDLVVEVDMASTLAGALDNGASLLLSNRAGDTTNALVWVFTSFTSDGTPPSAVLVDQRTGDVELLDCRWFASFPERHVRFRVDPSDCALDAVDALHLAVIAGEDLADGSSINDTAPNTPASASEVNVAGPIPSNAGALRPAARPRTITDTCDGSARDAFSDDDGSPFEAAIDCVAGYGIAEGIGGGRFGGPRPLTGPQTAAFLLATLEAADVPVPRAGNRCPGDGGPLREAVERLRAAGVVDATACEATTMTRGRMAQWVVNAIKRAGVPVDGSTDFFVDDEGSAFEPQINRIAAAGIVQGTRRGFYAPGRALTRAQMSIYLARTLDAMLDAG